MKKRLTIHLANIPKKKVQTKDGVKEFLYNTITYLVNGERDALTIVDKLKDEGINVTKHYLSNIK